MAVLSTILYLLIRVRKREGTKKQQQMQAEVEQLRAQLASKGEEPQSVELQPPEPLAPEPPPDPPDELVAACAAGRCVLFSGSGLGAAAGYPTRSQFLRRLAEAAGDQNAIDLVRKGETSLAAEVLSTTAGAERVVQEVRKSFGVVPDLPTASETESTLGRIPFRSAITNTWDEVVDNAFRNRLQTHVTQDGRFLSELEDSEIPSFVLTKLYGDLVRPETILLSPSRARDEASKNHELRRVISTQFHSYSFFFCGTNLDEIEHFLTSFGITDAKGPHYALVEREDDLVAKEKLFEDRYGIHVLAFSPSSGEYREISTFLRGIVERLPAHKPKPQSAGDVEARTLQSIRLENIGPFEELKIDFHDKWNVLLGNNGCGKSTILKAISIALCGEEKQAHPAAARLLRRGQDEGLIAPTGRRRDIRDRAPPAIVPGDPRGTKGDAARVRPLGRLRVSAAPRGLEERREGTERQTRSRS